MSKHGAAPAAKRPRPQRTAKHGKTGNQPICPMVGCDHPITDNAYICRRCGDQLRTNLDNMASLAEDLGITYALQSQMTAKSSGSKNAESQLPWHEKARVQADELATTLATWAKVILKERALDDLGPTCGRCHHDSCKLLRAARPPGNDVLTIARWLLGNEKWLRHHPSAPEIAAAVKRSVRRATSVIDRRPDYWYAGVCRGEFEVEEDDGTITVACCLNHLYADPDATEVRCRECDNSYDVTERRQFLLLTVEDKLAHAGMIASAVTRLGEPVTPERIRQWKHRGRIATKGQDRKGRDLFRIGDVIQLLHDQAEAEAKRASKDSRRVAAAVA